MKINRYFSLSLLAAGILAGCSTAPKNTALDEARGLYSSAQTNPQVVNLAPVELQRAGETLKKADAALGKGEDTEVNQLAYMAKQQVAIAQETARRKVAEESIANATAQRDQVRLAARTAEAEAAKRQAAVAQQSAKEQAERDRALIAARQAELDTARQQAAIAQKTADEQAAALAAASAQAQRDEALITARQAELDVARQQAAIAQKTADGQAAALAAASAQAQRDEAIIAARQAEAETARQQAAAARHAADQQAAVLEAVRAQAERDKALIAQQEQQLKELDAKQTPRGMVITLGDVLFAVNKAQLSAGGARNVQKLADFLNQYPQRKVLIEGHTDSTGSRGINQPLSERRADAVRSALAGMGIGADRIETRGYADAYPVASNNNAAGRQMNRRVEIILSDDKGNIVPR